MTLAELPLVLMLVGLTAYAVLGGADFGAAFWQLGARGEQGGALRQHAYRAMGPVWEANHVWLIFVLVICWTAYPEVFASIFSTLTVPLFIAAIGIILRGTAYAIHAGTAREIERRAVDRIFSISSVLTPFALGTVVGAIASGRVPVGNAQGDLVSSWLNASSFVIGFLAVASGAYVAAVYLAGDGARAGREDLASAFRTRALGAGVITGAIALVALLVVHSDGGRVGERLLERPAISAVACSAAAGLFTLELTRRSRFEAARYGASAAVAFVILGWALAQRPELLPGLTVDEAAAGRTVLLATVVGVAIGALVLIPSLVLLFGLVLRGRFDEDTGDTDGLASNSQRRPTRMSLLTLAVGAGAVGLLLTLIFDGGPSRARHRRPVRLRRARVYRHRERRDVLLGAVAANPASRSFQVLLDREQQEIDALPSRVALRRVLAQSRVSSREKPAADDQRDAGYEEREVPSKLATAFVDVVKAEEVMVNDAFDEVEDAPAREHPAEERASRVDGPVSQRVPEHPQADDGEKPGGGVEEAVRAHVGFHAFQSGCGPAVRAGEHVVPLNDLVENDAVHESSEADSEQDAGPG